jgi:hypothetical protein
MPPTVLRGGSATSPTGLRSRVVNDRINVRVDNDLAGGDPAPNTEKWLWVTYTVDGGAEQRVRINENQRLSLP